MCDVGAKGNIHLSDGRDDDNNFVQVKFIANKGRLFVHVGAILISVRKEIH